MKVQKNWPYAYSNLQKSLKELVNRLEKNDFKNIRPLDEYINPKETPNQLKGCIDVLTPVMVKLKESKSLEDKVTGMLIHKFITDAGFFKDNLTKEMRTGHTEFVNYFYPNALEEMAGSKQSELFSKIRNNNIDDVRKILNSDKELLVELDVDEWSAIHYCAAYGTPEMLEILTEYGADIDARTSGHYTPSMLAARQDNIRCLKKLYDLGADMTVTNNSNCNVIDFLADHDKLLGTMLSKVEDATLQEDELGEHLQVLLGDSIVYQLECC